ncbi:spore germination protein GerKA [Acetivibrio straminisolvens JCM 21531]|uniref:Spore germination protein GerKA n=1 Tax=Acetivibrio straminisolvens JCM 21531 TaxID=1294263 RepID=W4V938_9FIRM|nr:spore germination protein [Acetivibrio straminisolvens]GAE89333.1 spore germination protein GerKA [Acetivibrio straminisolvens JCM 21531]
MLAEGKVAVIMSGSPFALVMPTTNNDLLQSAEDAYVRFPYTNLLRIIRVIAIFMSLLLPGLYVAITNFHHEMIPTDLLFAIEASRKEYLSHRLWK